MTDRIWIAAAKLPLFRKPESAIWNRGRSASEARVRKRLASPVGPEHTLVHLGPSVKQRPENRHRNPGARRTQRKCRRSSFEFRIRRLPFGTRNWDNRQERQERRRLSLDPGTLESLGSFLLPFDTRHSEFQSIVNPEAGIGEGGVRSAVSAKRHCQGEEPNPQRDLGMDAHYHRFE